MKIIDSTIRFTPLSNSSSSLSMQKSWEEPVQLVAFRIPHRSEPVCQLHPQFYAPTPVRWLRSDTVPLLNICLVAGVVKCWIWVCVHTMSSSSLGQSRCFDYSLPVYNKCSSGCAPSLSDRTQPSRSTGLDLGGLVFHWIATLVVFGLGNEIGFRT